MNGTQLQLGEFFLQPSASPQGKVIKVDPQKNSITIYCLYEVRRWVLQWGGRAKVLEPAELIEEIRRAVTRLMENYESCKAQQSHK
jgi:predicted DNA-binding transcriptional regulator YafY